MFFVSSNSMYIVEETLVYNRKFLYKVFVCLLILCEVIRKSNSGVSEFRLKKNKKKMNILL